MSWLNDAAAVTPPLFVGGATELRASVAGSAGTHEEHVVALEGSLAPGGPWTDLETTIAGEDAVVTAAPPWLYVRARLATPEGAESTGCVAVYAR